jgi:hypothetical protein
MSHELTGKNYAEAKKMGYDVMHVSLQRGYVSTKAIDDNQMVLLGGQKHDKPYILGHYSKSTQYCWRRYLRKESTK